MSVQLPTLWQIDVSHYSEKARWALDRKRVAHRRRSPVPGAHMAIALWLTGGSSVTFPILEMDGRRIADSTEIVAALEQRHPERPLYPADPRQRRRALELEDFFDEGLGPHIRLVAFHELGNDRERLEALMERVAPGPMKRVAGPTATYVRSYTGLRFGVRERGAVEHSKGKVLEALDRLERELGSGDGEFLVGDSFSVADLTAAALFYPLALPPEGPLPADEEPPRGLREFRAPLESRPGYRWVLDTFRRHREPARPTVAANP